ncbi:TonB-dependent receptor [Thalassotalea sp. M1531]|uniref:TonB-dependent receptor n=1 Tax=Thalassotalea algicola TaxID=2716224 RepID=A0A7Y0LCS6_9GAMM|nr:TonB-dependent receptor [Thalassotalea algicola]NMP31737.1 TonB-dependent receptor [Thalassotalea algicola]
MKHKLSNSLFNNKKVSQHSIIAIAIGASLATSPMTFANNLSEEEVITVTASRTPVNIDTALASVVVITQADIARIQPKSLNDILATVAGIDITSQGGRGQNSSLFMRGANSNHTLVLVDGIRVSSASLGSTNTQIIAPELIERIEVLKGPRAAIWGSDAIGGVIQIFTRKLQSNEYFAGATFGSDNYQQLKAGAGFSHGDGHTSISVNREESDGFDVLEAAEEDNDGYEFDSIAVKGQQQVSANFTLDWLARADQGENEYDNAWGGNNEAETRNHAWLVRGTYNAIIGHVQNSTTFSVGQNRDFARNYGKHLADNTETEFETKRNQLSLLNHSQVFPFLQFNLGADFYQEKLNGTTTYDTDERDVTGIFAHTLYNKNKLTFEAAVRYDDVEHIDSETSYNVGLGYQLGSDTRIALNAGTGFKAPTFNDLYYPASPYSAGNEDLVSENSENIELVLETKLANVELAFNVYQSDIENLIAWQADENFFYKPENINDVEISGVEFIASYQGFGGGHQLNASYVDAEDKTTGKQLIRRAKEQFSYQFDTKVGELSLYVEYQYKGKRDDTSFATGDIELDSYQLVNLSASYPLTANLTVEARLTNAFDEEYQTALGYNTQERAGYLGINYAM